MSCTFYIRINVICVVFVLGSRDKQSDTNNDLDHADRDPEDKGVFNSTFVKFFCNITGITEIRVLLNLDHINSVMEKIDESMFHKETSTLQVCACFFVYFLSNNIISTFMYSNNIFLNVHNIQITSFQHSYIQITCFQSS